MRYRGIVAAAALVATAQRAGAAVQPADGADVELMVLREVNSDRTKPGEIVKLQVNKELAVDGGVIPAGTPAFGEVMRAQASSAALQRGGISIRLVRLVIDGRDVPLTGDAASKGRGGQSDDVVKVLFVPLYALFARGNSGKFKAGEVIHGRLPAGFRLHG